MQGFLIIYLFSAHFDYLLKGILRILIDNQIQLLSYIVGQFNSSHLRQRQQNHAAQRFSRKRADHAAADTAIIAKGSSLHF